jgi:hypothetical protein
MAWLKLLPDRIPLPGCLCEQAAIDELELSDAGGQLLDLHGGMRPGVLGVGDEPSNRALLDMPNSERGTTLRGPYGECGPAPGLARGSWKGTPIRTARARRRLVRDRFRIAWFQILMHTSFHETLLYCNSTLPRAPAFWFADAVPCSRAESPRETADAGAADAPWGGWRGFEIPGIPDI